MLLTNTATATITNNANPTVVIAPPMPQIEASENVALTAKFNNPKAMTQPTVGSWMWTLQGAGGGAVYGTLANGDGSATASGGSFCSTSNAATYTSTQTDPVTSSQSDLVEANAYAQPNCQGTAPATQPGIDNITTRATPNLVFSPTSATLQAGGSATFTVTFPSLDSTGFSYMWGTPGAVGSLTDSGANGSGKTGLLSYCSNSNTATFVASSLKVTAPQPDSLTLKAFVGANCVADNQIGRSASAVIILQPTPSVTGTPTQLLGQMQASNGFVYAVGQYTVPAYTGGILNFPGEALGDTIFRIQADGTVQALASLTTTTYDAHQGKNVVTGNALTPLVEGPDDALYGLAANGGGSDNIGYFYKFSLSSQTVTVLHNFSLADGSFGTDQYGNNLYIGALQGPLLLASDGNFYVGGSGGVVKLTPAGAVSIASSDGVPVTYGPFVQVQDGNLYSTRRTNAVTDSNGNIVTQSAVGLVSLALGGGGTANPLYSFGGPFYAFTQPNTPLVAGSDGALYGTLSGERSGFGACELVYTSNTDPGVCKPVNDAHVFRFDPNGGYSSIYTFNSPGDGTEPLIGLVAGPDGDLYGATTAGGDLNSECITFPTQYEVTMGKNYYGTVGPVRVSDEGCGTIFRISPSGTYTKMYQFQEGAEGRLALGQYPPPVGVQQYANLALDAAGNVLGSSAVSRRRRLYVKHQRNPGFQTAAVSQRAHPDDSQPAHSSAWRSGDPQLDRLERLLAERPAVLRARRYRHGRRCVDGQAGRRRR